MSSPGKALATCVDTLDLESELREAIADIERGDYIELTPEQLERCAVDGEWPWPDESLG